MADAPRIADASPLIVLARIGRIDLITPAVVPRGVADEILAGPAGDAARLLVEAGSFGAHPHVPVPTGIQEWGLGAGESAVLALAMSIPGAEAVLDDAQGRRCARAFSVPVVGTLGLVVRAVRAGRLAEAAPLVRDLRSAGLRIDDALVAEVLRRALAEEWTP